MYRNQNNRDGEIKVLMDIIEYELANKNGSQASHHINELEHLISHHYQKKQYYYLTERLEKYHRSLTKLSA